MDRMSSDVTARRVANITRHLIAPTAVVANPTSGLYPQGLLFEQVAIITGSGQGIGAKCAEMFAKEGAKVVVTDLDVAKSDAMAASIIASGGSAVSFPGDITKEDFPDKLVKFTIEKFGKLNIIVNNAGYTWDGIIHKMTDKQYEAMLLVHNTAPFRLIRAAAPYLRDPAKKEIDQGLPLQPRSIVNISSISGTLGNAGQANYSTAKAGIVGLTKAVAKEWGFLGIRCNAIAFGTIQTRLTDTMSTEAIEVEGQKIKLGIPAAAQNPQVFKATVPMQRKGTVEEAAGSIVMLCSPLAGYITGQCITVSGGV
eukprot:TRINITY_DN11457_c0_g1_i1.p1 TRINITY_DN11457_c0_g1~~TRINITY_DN11457_c0_g1_i1.p1  ORF type:complete len:311 (-),score=77.81 TRINITY_DN11457_c0_g1_i1:125-1057(-)